ncbi:MAG: phenylalanine 4-monooxygenase [Alphaproteobacteria bacterium]
MTTDTQEMTAEEKRQAELAKTYDNKKIRGDYSTMRPDYTIDQDYSQYTEEMQDRWRRLYKRQYAMLPGYACDLFIKSLDKLGFDQKIPDIEEVSAKLKSLTGWTLVAVPGAVPGRDFFKHLAEKRFPLAVWLREEHEMDYLEEPDMFHDFFGHVPLLADPVYADFVEAFGKAAGEAGTTKRGLDGLGRLYWFMVEFGLINTEEGLRIFGAGILSSTGETKYALDSEKPNRIKYDLTRIARTSFSIHDYQKTYFVVDSFEDLYASLQGDMMPFYESLTDAKYIEPAAVLPIDDVIQRGTLADEEEVAA